MLFFEVLIFSIGDEIDQASYWPSLIWFGVCLVLSIWGSGLNLLGKPRWMPPRLMFFTTIMSFLSRIMEFVPSGSKMLKGRKFYVYVFEDHMQRNTFVHRINEWFLRLSDYEGLTLEQRIERISWTGVMIVSSVMVLGSVDVHFNRMTVAAREMRAV